MTVRIPEVIFKASEHGYNLHTVFAKCLPYQDSYEHSILLIQSTQGAVFGAYLDVIPNLKYTKALFQGTTSSFVFTLAPTLSKY